MVLRYIVVNGRSPRQDGYCGICHTNLEQSYTRDLVTGITYHNPWCLFAHELSTLKCLEANYAAHGLVV